MTQNEKNDKKKLERLLKMPKAQLYIDEIILTKEIRRLRCGIKKIEKQMVDSDYMWLDVRHDLDKLLK